MITGYCCPCPWEEVVFWTALHCICQHDWSVSGHNWSVFRHASVFTSWQVRLANGVAEARWSKLINKLTARHSSKHTAKDRCYFNAGPASQTLAQHYNNIMRASLVRLNIYPSEDTFLLIPNKDARHPFPWLLRQSKWNEWGFRPPLCTYRLNWARRTSWGWWDERDDTALLTQDSIFLRFEVEHATSRSRRHSGGPSSTSVSGGSHHHNHNYDHILNHIYN